MRNYAEQNEAKKVLKICKEKHAFCVNKYSQKYFPCVSKTFPVLQQNSLCFPCLEKVRTKFPFFPVPWPPCFFPFSTGFSIFMSAGCTKCVTHFEKDEGLHRIQFFAEQVRHCPTCPQHNSVGKTENRDTELKTLTEWIFQLRSQWKRFLETMWYSL